MNISWSIPLLAALYAICAPQLPGDPIADDRALAEWIVRQGASCVWRSASGERGGAQGIEHLPDEPFVVSLADFCDTQSLDLQQLTLARHLRFLYLNDGQLQTAMPALLNAMRPLDLLQVQASSPGRLLLGGESFLPARAREVQIEANVMLGPGSVRWLGKTLGMTECRLSEVQLQGTTLAGLAVAQDLRVLTLEKLARTDLRTLPVLPTLRVLNVTAEGLEPEFGELVAQQPALETVSVVCPSLNDAFVVQLCRAPRLREVALQSNRLSPRAAVTLSQVPGLEVLSMDNVRIDLAAAQQIGAMPAVREVGVEITGLDAAGVAALCQAPALERLTMFGGQITAAAVTPIGNAPKLRAVSWLGYQGTADDEVLERLCRSGRLEALTLGPCRLTHRGFDALQHCRGLRYLAVAHALDKASFQGFSRLTQLERLIVRFPESDESDAWYYALCEALPNCDVSVR